MIRLLPALMLVILFSTCFADLVNVNPDPNGDPWYVGELRPLTAADSTWLASLPRLTTPQGYRPLLRNEVDNSTQPWFRPVFQQQGGSCGQASGVGYNYTYEIDRLRNVPASSTTNQYPTHYTWNFLNGGNGGGSWYWDGWNIIAAGGVCNVAEYGGDYAYGGPSRWLSGFDSYYSGMDNRMGEVMAIEVSTPTGLETLKGWMNDYLNGSEVGGLANFGSGVSPYLSEIIPEGSEHAGEKIVLGWGPSVNHAMTFVGYNDSIRYDFNGDGEYTNDVDTNEDGVVDMRDWEIGALKVANSWGEGFENNGFVWMAYRLLALPVEDGGIWNGVVHVIQARDDYSPLIVASATVSHERRNAFKLVAGVSTDTTATEPQHILEFPHFHYQGGPLYMQGGETPEDKTLEFGLDLTPLLGYIEPGQPARWFLELHEDDPNDTAWGQLNLWSVQDHTSMSGGTWVSQMSDVEVVNDGVTRIWADAIIDYQPVTILTETLPDGYIDEPYEYELNADYGEPPYTWRLLREYDESAIDWEAPTPEGLEVPLNNLDDGYGVVALPFTFPFYTDAYDSVLVSSDGSIVFDSQVISVRTAENLINTRAITPYGTDLQIYPDQGDGVWCWMTADMLRVCWVTSRFDNPSYHAVFEARLFADGSIEFVYGDDNTPDENWVAGVSEGDGGNFTMCSFSGAGPLPDNAAAGFDADPLPPGMALTENGWFTGMPQDSDIDTWNLTVRVTDNYNVSDEKTLAFHTTTNGVSDSPELIGGLRAWPNPFNPTTQIAFSLTQPANVSLEVFNIRGQHVATLLHTRLESGEHAVTWRGLNDSGDSVASGVYFARLKAGEKTVSRKLLLLK